jgi:fatty-acyl-CoA synthase
VPGATNEVGEAIGRNRGDSAQLGGEFEGYTSANDSERKILRDVFALGDAWYCTGDLMLRDTGGFFYFIDRIGDAFRWKGARTQQSPHSPAYGRLTSTGVRVPGTDGAASRPINGRSGVRCRQSAP